MEKSSSLTPIHQNLQQNALRSLDKFTEETKGSAVIKIGMIQTVELIPLRDIQN